MNVHSKDKTDRKRISTDAKKWHSFLMLTCMLVRHSYISLRMRSACHFLASVDIPFMLVRSFEWTLIIRWCALFVHVIFSFVNVIRFLCVKRHSFLMRWLMRHSCDRAFRRGLTNCNVIMRNESEVGSVWFQILYWLMFEVQKQSETSNMWLLTRSA